MHTPVNPSITIRKGVSMRYKSHGHVILMFRRESDLMSSGLPTRVNTNGLLSLYDLLGIIRNI